MPPIHTILFSRRAICWNLHHTMPWRAPVHTVVWLTHFHPQRRRCHVDCNAQSLISLHFIISTTCSVILIHCYFSLRKRPHYALYAVSCCEYARCCVGTPTPRYTQSQRKDAFAGRTLRLRQLRSASLLAMTCQQQRCQCREARDVSTVAADGRISHNNRFCQSSSRSYRYTLDFRRGVVGAHCLLHRIVGTEHFSIFPIEENTR